MTSFLICVILMMAGVLLTLLALWLILQWLQVH
jgi:hypothetical protein